MAESKLAEIEEVYKKSSLPEAPDFHRINELLVEIRKNYYAI
jgi:hypothetical protein